ncbi:MAG TPA: hypothetical protein VKA48_01205 [Gammaproteobacteria bacterium]|nr:hypothetical protein [Gammaproteobacteria bacterium]
MRRITAEMLTQKGAHCAQFDEVQERFPDGVDVETVTPEEVADLSVGWAVQALLPAPARKAFKEAEATAWKDYVEATGSAWKEAHRGSGATAWKAYLEAEARAAIRVFRQYWR